MRIPCDLSPLWLSRVRRLIYPLLVAALIGFFGLRLLHAGPSNGFDLGDALIPADQIHHGGPPRDGIPAIDRPRFVSGTDATFLDDGERVLGIDRNGIRKAYPIKILNYHEIVNDDFDGEAIVITYCPLCGTGMAFEARVDGEVHRFGVSGLLYNNDVLLYDRDTESLWSQLMKQAVTGPMRGNALQQIVMAHTTWAAWRRRYPDSLVLSTETGYRRDYQRSPYAGYSGSEALYFPLAEKLDRRYHPKELVIGLSLNGQHKAYPFAELSRSRGELDDRFAGRQLRILFDAANRTGQVLDSHGTEIASTIAYWFAWQAFHPQTAVYKAP
jgi:hypothetical protein